MRDVISVSCASDHNYLCGLLVTLHSLWSHCSPAFDLKIHVLDIGLLPSDRETLRNLAAKDMLHRVSVEFHEVSVEVFADMPAWRGGHAAYARLLLQDVLEDEDYTVYTDIDTLWLRDVSELWAKRDGHALWAVPDGSGLVMYGSGEGKAKEFRDQGVEIDPATYYCSGLLMMNLKRLREMNFTECVLKTIREHAGMLYFPDQDLYNFILPAPQTGMLDWHWGEFAAVYGLRETESPRVIHYANAAPWTHSLSAVGMLWWRWMNDRVGMDALGDAADRFRRAYRKNVRRFAFMRSPLGGLLMFRLMGLLNKRLVRKWNARIFPEKRTRIDVSGAKA